MLLIIIALIIIASLCFLFGLLFIKFILLISDTKTAEQVEPTIIIWLGLIFICWLLMIFNLWIKIGLVVFLCLLGTAILTIFWKKKDNIKLIQPHRLNLKNNILLIIVTTVYVFLIIAKSTSPNFNYDSGLYHIQNIKWLESFSIVPGLGNLHGRFAFNSNWFLLAALFGFQFLFSQRIYALNILIFCLCIIFLAKRISSLVETKKLSNILAFFLYFAIIMIHGFVNSPTTDLPSDLILWITIILFIEKLESKTLSTWNLNSWIILFLALFAVTIKFSTAPLMLLPFLLMLFTIQNDRRILWKGILVSLVFTTPWIIRNIIIAGTIIYPISILHLPWFDWSIPSSQIDSMKQIIHDWAIMPGPLHDTVKTMSVTQWVIPWLERMSFFKIFILTAFFGNIILLINDIIKTARRRSSKDHSHLFFLSLDVYLLVSLLFWFFSAPDPRFAYGLIVAGFLIFLIRLTFPLKFKRILMDSLLIGNLVLFLFLFSIIYKDPSFSKYFLIPPKVPIPQMERISYNSDSFLYIPVNGDQCWDEELPCAPKTIPWLVMRGKNLSDGFRLDLEK